VTVRTWRVAAVALVAGVLVACTPPSVLPDGTVPQDPPIASNGLVADGPALWVADLFGGQILRFDPDTGRILRRVGRTDGIAPPDDGVVLADGSLVYTSPLEDLVGRIFSDGRTEVITRPGFAPNPIIVDPADPTGAVIVGCANAAQPLYRVFLDGRAPEPVSVTLPPINSFTLGPDGRVWAPAGGLPSAFGTGGVLRIDLGTGATEPLSLTFPEEPGKVGFNFAVAAKFGPDGQLYVLQGFDAAVYRVDPTMGEARRMARIPDGVADNLIFTPSGDLYASAFFGPVYQILGDGSVRRVPLGAG
jgi:sugar lactone lactonase YvrE